MRVVLTRPEARGRALAERLRAAGHEVACIPVTEIVDLDPFPDPAPFDGVLFTSVNAVERAPTSAKWPRVGAVGAATAAALEERGIPVDVIGTGGGVELGVAWGPAHGQRLLLPQAEGAHPGLEKALSAQDAELSCVCVYRSVPAVGARDPLARADVICFFAPSQVRAFLDLGLDTSATYWGVGPTTRAAMVGLSPQLDDIEELT